MNCSNAWGFTPIDDQGDNNEQQTLPQLGQTTQPTQRFRHL
jgi:hypothetical protein